MKWALLFLCLVRAVWAQSAPAFEVATVRTLGPTELPDSLKIDGARIRISGFNLQSVILEAYQIKENQLTGPAWLATERFVIEATLPPGATQDQFPAMLQGLLADRFRLKARRVTKEETVYAIVPDRGGLRIREKTGGNAAPPAEPAMFRAFSGSFFMAPAPKFVMAGGDLQITVAPNLAHVQASKISSLAELLSQCSDKPVVDRTNLKGSYQIEMDVNSDDKIGDWLSVIMAPPGANDREPDRIDAGLIRGMLKGLGLTVENRTEPVETVVIDSIEKTPTAN